MEGQQQEPDTLLRPLAMAGGRVARLRGPTPWETLRGVAYAGLIFAAFGTLTALWENPFFTRMTPVAGFDFVLLGAEALLVGLFMAVRAGNCGIKSGSLGGVAGFLGFGCSICNKLLLFAFGADALLSYFEPWRHTLGVLGVAVLGVALLWRLRGSPG